MNGIEKGSPEWDVIAAALDVAVYPPLDPKTPTTNVSVVEITKLRNALDAVGIDWRKVKGS